MDGSSAEHSDSDSGESWTLLENSSAYGDDAPDSHENTPPFEREQADVSHDEDTDGISIITDSDPESSPCDVDCDKCMSEESRPTEHQDPSCILNTPLAPNINSNALDNQDDFLRDNNGTHKTYVHRRNKRLSTMLNIIMLGSIITAAGVAIGHMWGAKNECTMQTVPSVNKILSNLYKLQEENAFLRNKLKELTLTSNIQREQKRFGSEKKPPQKQRSKKMFEEPLHEGFKCMDNDINKPQLLNNKGACTPLHEKEFLKDLNKVKTIYQQNKTWLDSEIAAKMKRNYYDQPKNSPSTVKQEMTKTHRQINLDLQIERDNIEDILNDRTKSIRQKNLELQIGPEYKQYKQFLEARTNSRFENINDNLSALTTTTHRQKCYDLKIGLKNINHNLTDKTNKQKNLELKIGPKNINHKQLEMGFLETAYTNKDKNINDNLTERTKTQRQNNLELQIGPTNNNDNLTDLEQLDMELFEAADTNDKKISYADSLKTEPTKKTRHIEEVDIPQKHLGYHNQKKKSNTGDLIFNLNSVSEEELKKDDRYTGPKTKQAKKKYDRQKLHKKQKRKNKYEQWEMKGGYLKDYDEFSIESSLGAETEKRYYRNPDFENYINQLTEPDKGDKPLPQRKGDKPLPQRTGDKPLPQRKGGKPLPQRKGDKPLPARKNDKPKKMRVKDIEWYEKRSALRAEARKKMEHELFGETSPSTAAWYFRRMQKREQCRAQKDNSTFKKLSKHKLNFKMKR